MAKTQGDCILIKTAQGKFILVDGGGSEFTDIAHRKLLPYLHHRGIREIWLMINTHPDTDHLQGLEAVIQEIRVRQVAIPDSMAVSDRYDGIKEMAAKQNIPIYRLYAGDDLSIEKGLSARVLYPDHNDNDRSTNNQSLVFYLRYGSFSTLLTGDIQAQGMHTLITEGELEPVTVVKVPHHGSKGSLLPAFYNETRPNWAVISVGANNRFGHPHPLVLEELARRNIKIFRTDQNGAITVKTDGQSSSISSYRQPAIVRSTPRKPFAQ
ncbi:MAG: ComEC/Rec2 family competence protein [Deltaproteobacteria bacterium]